ncbi:MAG: PAS domain S-box protein [Okeania sp. SIO3B5]|nr:PAS domain S-box protein [Okeania sp. SIO3B5]
MMLQTSGAERLVLLLPDADNTWQVRVMATFETTQLVSDPLMDNPHLPVQLIQYVQHTQEILVVDGLDRSLPIVDSYLQQHSHRSVLCLPLMHQTKLIGLLYLEHHSLSGVFSCDRITIVNFLCSQVSISLGNALLNQKLEQKLEVKTAQLQASEARLRNMVDNIPGVVYQARVTADEAYSFLYVSPNCHALYEVSAEAMMSGKYSLRDFEYSEDKPIIHQTLIEVNQTLQPFDSQFRIVTPSGTLKWVHVIACPIPQPDGATLWDGIVMDVSDRKQAEEQLKVLSTRLELALQSAEIGIWEWNFQDNHLSWNNRMFEIYGIQPEAFEGSHQDWEKFVHPDDLEQAQSREEDKYPVSREFRVIRPDGSVRYVASTVIREYNDQRQLIREVGTHIDITPRKAIELALQESERRYASLATAAPVVIYRLDKPLHISYINERWSEMTGRPPETALGYGWMDVLHPDDREEFVVHWSEVYSREDLPDEFFMHGSEGRHLRPDGTVNWFYSRLARELDEHGNVVGYIGTLTDITERKEAELALQDAQAQFHRMTENVPGMIFRYVRHVDGIEELTYVSSQVRELFEVEPEIALQNTLWHRIHPEDVPKISHATQVEAETLQRFVVPYRVILPEKGIRWLQNINSVKRLENGDTVWDGIVIDISDSKQVEEQLKALSTRLELALKSAKIGIWEWNLQDNHFSWDDRMFEIYGVSPETFGGTHQDWEKFVHPDDLEQAQSRSEDKYPVSREFRVIRPDGSVRYVVSTVIREYNDQGQPIRAVGTNIDITPRKAIEIALQESERRYASLAAAAPVAIFRMDKSMNCTYVNDRWEEMTGHPLESALGKGWMHTLHPDDLENAIVTWTEIYANLPSGSPVLPGAEGRHLRPDGTIRWHYVQIAQELDYYGNVVGYVGTLTDITERKEAELALQDSQAQFHRMTENVPGMIYRYIIHANGSDELTYVSSQVREIFEVEPEIARQSMDSLWERIHPDDVDRVKAQIQYSAETRQPFKSQYRLVLPQKGLRWVQNVAHPEYFDNSNVMWDGVVIDITDRKAAEKSLNLTQFAVDKTALGIFYIREDGSFLEVNESACSNLGYSYEELKKRYIWEINLDLQPHEWRYYWECLKQKSVAKYEVNHQRQDGSIFPVEVICNYLEYDGEGFVFAQVQNISDRKRAELALEQEVLRRTTIFNTSSDGIHILDIKGNLIEANATFFQMLGYIPAEAWHLNVSDWDAKFSLKQIQANLEANFLDPSKVRVVETLHRRKDGSVFPVETSVCSMEWNGQVSFICIARDISERKQAETQLQRTNEELMRATRLKDEFLANMSHELRTPLNSILGLSEALQDEVFGPLTDKQLKYLKTIERNGNHLLSLINDILDVSKIESGQLELDLEVTNIGNLCESSLAFVKQQAVKKSISLNTAIPPHSLNLLIDERRILQSLVNLLNNAVKFTAEGGSVALEVSCHHQNKNWQRLDSQEQSEEVENPNQVVWESGKLTARSYIKISVRDTGIGIAPEQITKLFKPFSQTDSALNRKYNGTGLGLVLVKQMTELHGGTVSLTSEVGVGSCFSINLPYDSDSSLSNPESLSDDIDQPNLPSSVQSEDLPLILLAEDNEDNISVMVSYLEKNGYRLIVAKNGLDAILLAQTHRPDLILMDIQMPELDGLKAIERIRQDSNLKPIPIVALTALAMAGDRERCLEAGANLYLSKPVKLKQLVSHIQKLLVQ